MKSEHERDIPARLAFADAGLILTIHIPDITDPEPWWQAITEVDGQEYRASSPHGEAVALYELACQLPLAPRRRVLAALGEEIQA